LVQYTANRQEKFVSLDCKQSDADITDFFSQYKGGITTFCFRRFAVFILDREFYSRLHLVERNRFVGVRVFKAKRDEFILKAGGPESS
jgi:hypothetical protein